MELNSDWLNQISALTNELILSAHISYNHYIHIFGYED